MRKHAIVFVDIERDQATDGRDAVQRVEEKPLMFQRAPPRFDHRVRELQFGEGQQPAQDACAWRIAKFLNISGEVAILLGSFVRDLAVLFLRLLTTAARPAGRSRRRPFRGRGISARQTATADPQPVLGHGHPVVCENSSGATRRHDNRT
jgi:hypothetical protein